MRRFGNCCVSWCVSFRWWDISFCLFCRNLGGPALSPPIARHRRFSLSPQQTKTTQIMCFSGKLNALISRLNGRRPLAGRWRLGPAHPGQPRLTGYISRLLEGGSHWSFARPSVCIQPELTRPLEPAPCPRIWSCASEHNSEIIN